ncbi:hypothetical protein JCM8547_007435 [Rhodosporidiobolus lusitaniae]
MPRLEVSIGPDRFHQEVACVNDASRPTQIDTPLFAGRVLILVKDFTGVTPDGSAPKRDSRYFESRSRKFAIVIEGRFKRREGVEPYTGEEIQFGSDFDYMPESFPQGPFNAGMKIAQWVDPATYYETNPAHGRPFIMSPYTACMNTFCAYPSPDALSRAVVLSHHDSEHPHHPGEENEGSFVPVEGIDAKHKWHERAYWRFLGLKGDPRVDTFLAAHSELMLPPSSTSSSSSSRPGLSTRPSSLILGTAPSAPASSTTSAVPTPVRSGSPAPPSDAGASTGKHGLFGWGAPIPRHSAEEGSTSSTSTGSNTPSSSAGGKKKSRFSLASLAHALEGKTSAGGERDHVLMADQLVHAGEGVIGEKRGGPYEVKEGVEKALGPWRFGDETVDAMEDSTFIFLDPDHPRSVAQRRKHFVTNDGQNRKSFVYDPNLIYTTSFFTPFCDLNTFDLKMGPVNINIAPYFTRMPIRYTLRSTRLAPPPDGSNGSEEEEVFVTISFRLVD